MLILVSTLNLVLMFLTFILRIVTNFVHQFSQPLRKRVSSNCLFRCYILHNTSPGGWRQNRNQNQQMSSNNPVNVEDEAKQDGGSESLLSLLQYSNPTVLSWGRWGWEVLVFTRVP